MLHLIALLIFLLFIYTNERLSPFTFHVLYTINVSNDNEECQVKIERQIILYVVYLGDIMLLLGCIFVVTQRACKYWTMLYTVYCTVHVVLMWVTQTPQTEPANKLSVTQISPSGSCYSQPSNNKNKQDIIAVVKC